MLPFYLIIITLWDHAIVINNYDPLFSEQFNRL